MSEFDDLEAQLREAHAFAPREGLREEVRASLRPARVLPWAGFSAAAAVLLAVVGVGFLLLHHPSTGPIAASAPGAQYDKSAAGTAGGGAAVVEPFKFGKLPALPMDGARATSQAAAPASNGLSAQPDMALVYRWVGPGIAHCTPPGEPVLNGLKVLNGYCELNVSLIGSSYRIQGPPAGAELAYYAIQAGPVGYFVPVYRLPDGSLVNALTSDEIEQTMPP